MNESDRVVVVGASLAGSRAAQHLRRLGHTGPIMLIGEEADLPYDRPPLSKTMLTESAERDSVVFNDRAHYDELDIELVLGERANALNTTTRTVTVGDREISFAGLIIATGARARWLPDSEGLGGVHVIRTLDDAVGLRAELVDGARVVVVGAGFIGSEAAAAAAKRGCDVTVLEAGPAPMVRGLGAEIGALCGALHEPHGVRLLVDSAVAGLISDDSGDDRAVSAVELTDGTSIPADVVIIGIGVTPATEWLEGSGLTLDNGIVCDGTLNAGVPGIYAAGDVVRAPNVWLGPDPVRVEHWTTATEQGMLAAANLLDPENATEYDSVPFVWSDQYDDRIQIAGHPSEHHTVEILFGSPEEQSFVAGYRDGERLAGVVGLNSIRPFVKYRRLLSMEPTWSAALELASELAAPPE